MTLANAGVPSITDESATMQGARMTSSTTVDSSLSVRVVRTTLAAPRTRRVNVWLAAA